MLPRAVFPSEHRSTKLLGTIVAVLMITPATALAVTPDPTTASSKRPAGSVKLTGSLQKSVGNVRCGKIRGSWLPGTKLAGGYFISHTQQATNYKNAARRSKGKTRTKHLKAAAGFKTKASSQLKSCRAVTPTPPPASALRFSLAGAKGIALKSTSAVSSRANRRGGHAAAVGSALETISSTGVVADAITAGTADIKTFVIGPNNKVYIIFSKPENLATGQIDWNPSAKTCLLAEVPVQTGIATCVDDTLTSINFWGFAESPPVQFDSSGAIYYSGAVPGSPGFSRGVLRVKANGVVKDLDSGAGSGVDGFLVFPEGGLLATVQIQNGDSTKDRSELTRISADGSRTTILSSPPGLGFLRQFPDGNIYMSGSWFGPDASWGPGVVRYIRSTGQLDSKHWIDWDRSGSPTPDPYFARPDICGANGFTDWRFPFCAGGYRDASQFLSLSDGSTFAVALGFDGCGQCRRTMLMQFYPTVALPSTSLTNVAVAQGAGNVIVLAGTDTSGQNVMTLYNPADQSETPLLGADNPIEIYHMNYIASESKLLFDGLRAADNQYVLGEVDLLTKRASVTATLAAKWSQFDLLR